MPVIIKRFLYHIIVITSVSIIHLLLQIQYWPANTVWHVIGVILAIINLIALMHIFIRTTRLITIKKQFTAVKNKIIFGAIVLFGVIVNAIIMYTLFIVLFQRFSRLFS